MMEALVCHPLGKSALFSHLKKVRDNLQKEPIDR